MRLRRANALWLDRWEAKDPATATSSEPNYGRVFRQLRAQHKHSVSASFAIMRDTEMVGHLSFAPILWGPTMQASAGYWVAESSAGQGIAPVALAKGIDHMIHGWGLHRIEVLVRPENSASLAVVHKVGLRSEGRRTGAVFSDGRWRDHDVFAVTAEDVPTPEMLTFSTFR